MIKSGLTALLLMLAISCSEPEASPPLTPDEALESFVLADPELQVELVAAEPLVQDPVAITFDEQGRLWVVEMLGFMQDIDGTGEEDPVGRVNILYDDDGDGRMDRSQLFLDSLVLPRAIAVVKGGALVAENIPLWFAEDTDGDGTADRRTLIDAEYGGSGMPEHSANGLWRGMDNWYYNAKSSYRYRNIDGEWVRDSTEFRGQWGIAHDNAGRLFYNYNWSQLHADLVPPGALGRNPNHTATSGIDHGLTLERTIYPIRSNTAVNRGYVPGTLDEQGRLLEFASACGPLVYRGTALPEAYAGDAFVCEPTANLIKQNNIFEDGFVLRAQGEYDDREFLASTDERFRPISLASGPDGALYVVDMYKGIIQHGPYMTPYLREETLKRGLEAPIHMGRIWRITSRDAASSPKTDLSALTTGKLVELLGDPNGWTRDMAQRLLVERGDTGVVPALESLIRTGNPLGALHALWTLEGLDVEADSLYQETLTHPYPRVARAALRLLARDAGGDPEIRAAIASHIRDNFEGAPPLLQLQMVLSGNLLEDELLFDIGKQFLHRYGALPVARDALMSSLGGREARLLAALWDDPDWITYRQDKEIFTELLAAAIVRSGERRDVDELFRRMDGATDPAGAWLKSAVAGGMLQGASANEEPTELAAAPRILQDPERAGEELAPLIASLGEHFSWPGKPAPVVDETAPDYELDAAQMALGRTQYLNLCANCHGTQGKGMQRFAPPLRQSEWVLGEDYKLALILLNGMEGPVAVNGRTYDIPDILPSMPSFSTLQNPDLAAIATYIRNSWGNQAPPISGGRVTGIRFRTQGKVQPWKATELDSLELSFD